MLLRIDAQKLFHENSEENLGICIVTEVVTYHQSGLNLETIRVSRVRWKLFFTETISHHTVQILKSFIFMHYGAC